MRVWRAMSLEEFLCFPECWRGRVWFATDDGYIASVLARGMFHGRRVRDAYQVVVFADVKGYWSASKKELGYLNVALDVSKPFEVDVINVWMAGDWFASFGKRKLRPVGYYWNKWGELRWIVDRRELKNILVNGRLDRGLFVRADYLDWCEKSGFAV